MKPPVAEDPIADARPATPRLHVFVIGAAKSGTTALAAMLGSHPDICLSDPKETDYFTRVGLRRGAAWYRQRFAHDSEAPVRVDASVSYSAGWGGSCADTAARLAHFDPDARLIYVVRDPVERARAAYWHARRSGYESSGFLDAISREDNPYVHGSRYHARRSDYLRSFDRRAILLLRQDELLRAPQATLDAVFDWLGLARAQVSVASDVNSSYRLSPVGVTLRTVFPKSSLKRTAAFVRRWLPAGIRQSLLGIYARPLPPMTMTEARVLVDACRDDAERLFEEHGLEVRTSPWWQNCTEPADRPLEDGSARSHDTS